MDEWRISMAGALYANFDYKLRNNNNFLKTTKLCLKINQKVCLHWL